MLVNPPYPSPNVQFDDNELIPKRLRRFLWRPDEGFATPVSTTSETLKPLPCPPSRSDSDYTDSWKTIDENPHLFEITTPIKVDVFRALLRNHPNQPLVESVCDGLTNGFWPLAEHDDRYPTTHETRGRPFTPEESAFVVEYTNEEQAAGRYSPAFDKLLPGMYCAPSFTIPKKDPTKLRFVNNHSAGPYPLNDLIDLSENDTLVDRIEDLGRNLFANRQNASNVTHLFKSDIADAYRHLPMHPLWQLRQAVRVGDRYHIDRCCSFGSRGSPALWTTFISLVVWIAINVKQIPNLLVYFDDHFSFDFRPPQWYAPYQSYYPPSQVKLLQLWDEIGIRHKKDKQLYGNTLTIIGFHVDSRAMTISIPQEMVVEIATEIEDFCSESGPHSLNEWQSFLGRINFALSVNPMLRPGIESSYASLRSNGDDLSLDDRTRRDLLWVAKNLRSPPPAGFVNLLNSIIWSVQEAHITLFCDACMTGMAFWIPKLAQVFVAETEPSSYPASGDGAKPKPTIAWYEALTVLAALRHATTILPSTRPARVAIFTDNTATVGYFNSFSAPTPYHLILVEAAKIIRENNIDLRVAFIHGEENHTADAFSRGQYRDALPGEPGLALRKFQPPAPGWDLLD